MCMHLLYYSLATRVIFTLSLYRKINLKFYILTVVRQCVYKDEFASHVTGERYRMREEPICKSCNITKRYSSNS